MTDNVVKTVTDSGLTIVSERIPGIRSVSVGIWIRAGSATDTQDTMGMAHFVEHMLFKGTETRSPLDISREIESLGGSINAFTTREYTCFYTVSLDEHVDTSVDVLLDMLQHSIFPEHEIEREIKVVEEEISSVLDVPEDLVQDICIDATLSPLPCGKPILGTHDTVSSFTRDMLVDYTGYHYIPSNIVISSAGNIDHTAFTDSVMKRFLDKTAQKSGEEEHTSIPFESPTRITRDIQQSHICIGTQFPGLMDTRHVSLSVLNTILGAGMSSRLFQSIREKHGLAYSVYSFTESLESVSVMATYAATDAKDESTVTELAFDEYRTISTETVDTKTLFDAKNQLIGSLLISQESSFSRMARLAKNELCFGHHREIDDIINEIETVTPEIILELSQTFMSIDKTFTFFVSP